MRRRNLAISELSDRLQHASRDLANQAGRRAAAVSNRFPDAYRWTRSAARQASDESLRLAGHGYRIAGRRFGTANEIASDRLQGHVLPALMLAAATGYILSYLVHRNLRNARPSNPPATEATAPRADANESGESKADDIVQ